MEEKSLVKTGRNEIDKFVNEKSVLELVDSILYLDTIKPYVELSQNGEVGEFLQKRNYPVVYTKSDFDYLYESLRNRIVALEGKDERVKTYLQRTEYQKQMAQLPVLMSKLERTASTGFNELKTPLKAVFNYVWDAVIENGFKMKEEDDYIKKDGRLVASIQIFSGVYTNWYRLNLFKTVEYYKEKKGKLFYKTVERINPEVFIESRQFVDYPKTTSIDKFVENLKMRALKDSSEIKGIEDFLVTMLKLPDKMHEYVVKTERSLRSLFSDVKSLEKN